MALKEIPMHYVGLEASIAQVQNYLRTQIDDECFIFGFSQGATFCHVISILAHAAKLSDDSDSTISSFAKISKAILVSGFSSMHQNPLAECMKDATKRDIQQIQSLHIFGEGDTSVPKHFSEDLTSCFVNAEVYIHEKGHFIPHNKAFLDQVMAFLKS
jgi:predicted esterase